MERSFIEDRQSSQHIGAPGTVIDGLTDLIKQTGVDELMITTQTHDPADRLHSFDLVAAAACAR
jgi:alkanesulfonate monooxygenase SsuD/methylene tetrahydromethanopterin reductase-like flavin-dependent oxidoreductase (luciferase family)